VALLAAACVPVTVDVTFAPGAIVMQSPGSTVLQDARRPPVHIGDGADDAAALPAEYRLEAPPRGYGWRVHVQRPPAAAEVEATIEGLAPAGDPSGCHTELVVNDRPLARLQAPRAAGVVAVLTIPVPPGTLQPGENRVQVVSRECSSSPDRYEDSLIRSLLLRTH
jgi:hypothetical protein